jgi:hypothetical protein
MRRPSGQGNANYSKDGRLRGLIWPQSQGKYGKNQGSSEAYRGPWLWLILKRAEQVPFPKNIENVDRGQMPPATGRLIGGQPQGQPACRRPLNHTFCRIHKGWGCRTFPLPLEIALLSDDFVLLSRSDRANARHETGIDKVGFRR